MNKTIPLYNGEGHCTFVDKLGNDWTPCKAARVSFGDDSLKGVEKDTKLLRYLMEHAHTSPFEQCSITFNIRMPIFVMRQFVRHRTFRLNEESGRYSEMSDSFAIPTSLRKQSSSNMQGSDESFRFSDQQESVAIEAIRVHCERSYRLYQDLLEMGVAKEQARIILPLNLMTKVSVNCDLHNLMHFLKLRLDSHAQLEIRQLAMAMLEIFSSEYPVISSLFKEIVLDKNGIKY